MSAAGSVRAPGLAGIAPNVTDAASLRALRRRAGSDPGAALEEVAGRFEALFATLMLRSMRATVPRSALAGVGAGGLYVDLLDRQLAETLGSSRRLGIGDLLVRQLGGRTGAPLPPPGPGAAPSAAPSAPGASPRPAGVSGPASPDRHPPSPAPSASAGPAAPAAPAGRTADPAFAEPGAFVAAMAPHARRAAARLGVDPRVLIAQAALESGWGRKLIRGPDGSNSHNLFGIKAGRSWSGPTAATRTLEAIDGVLVPTEARFRVYAGYAESFDDYADLVAGSPRYREALAAAGDPAAYARELQAAGYATDPRYASKIVALLERVPVAALAG